MPEMLDQLLKVATQAAQQAGAIVKKGASNLNQLTVEQKSPNDFVSEIDRASEECIRQVILANFPSHRVVGEEYGVSGSDAAPIDWYVDPLDGTTNFLRAIPHYCVSIAAYADQDPLVAVVFDPIKNELFSAVHQRGAYLNGHPIKVAQIKSLESALLATGVPYSGARLNQLPNFLATLNGLLDHNTSGIRRLGSAALDLAYVAAGRYDGYWEAALHSWDIGAGMLLVQEAGGVCSDFRGEASCLSTGNIVAANPQVHHQMLTITSAHYPQD